MQGVMMMASVPHPSPEVGDKEEDSPGETEGGDADSSETESGEMDMERAVGSARDTWTRAWEEGIQMMNNIGQLGVRAHELTPQGRQ